MTTLLETHHLTVTINTTPLCHRLNCRIQEGQRWAILGRNGVGKTTLLHTLAGLRPPHTGEVWLLGRPIPHWTRRATAQVMGVLFQENTLPFPSTVWETVLIGRHPFLSPWHKESTEDIRMAHRALQRTDLLHLKNRLVGTLSGGEKRRLDVAVLLTQSPRLLLMDEPTNHLDLHHQISILDHLKQTVDQTQGAWIAVFHDINLAARYCNRFLFLFGGGETDQGTAEQMLQPPLLHRLFQHPLTPISDATRTVWIPK